MNRSIDLNSEPRFSTIKISDKSTQRMLASEFESAQPSASYRIPQRFLSLRHLRSEIPGDIINAARYGTVGFLLFWHLAALHTPVRFRQTRHPARSTRGSRREQLVYLPHAHSHFLAE